LAPIRNNKAGNQHPFCFTPSLSNSPELKHCARIPLTDIAMNENTQRVKQELESFRSAAKFSRDFILEASDFISEKYRDESHVLKLLGKTLIKLNKILYEA
jgi:hypothetical protein